MIIKNFISPIFLTFLACIFPLAGLLKNFDNFENIDYLFYLHINSYIFILIGICFGKFIKIKIFQSNLNYFFKFDKYILLIQLLIFLYILYEIKTIPILSGINNDLLYERLGNLLTGTLLLLLITNQILSIFFVYKFVFDMNKTCIYILLFQIFISFFLYKRQILASILCSYIFFYLYKYKDYRINLTHVFKILILLIIFILFFEIINNYRIGKLDEFEISYENSSLLHYLYMPIKNLDNIIGYGNLNVLRDIIFIDQDNFYDMINDVENKGVSFGFIGYCYIYGGYIFLFVSLFILGYIIQALYFSISNSNYSIIIYSFSLWPLLSFHSYTHFFSLYYFYIFIIFIYILNQIGKK